MIIKSELLFHKHCFDPGIVCQVKDETSKQINDVEFIVTIVRALIVFKEFLTLS